MLQSSFLSIDTESKGYIELDSFKRAFQSFNSEYNLDDIFTECDLDCDDKLSFDEFCSAASDHQKLLSNTNIKYIFNLFDRFKNNVITELEFEYVLPT